MSRLSQRPWPTLHRKRPPSGLDLGIFGEGESILHVDSEIADRIFDLAMAEQDAQLPGDDVAREVVEHGRQALITT